MPVSLFTCVPVLSEYKTRKIVVVIYYLQAGALIWQFQVCIDHPVSIHSILRNIELHCLTTSCYYSQRFILQYRQFS